MVREVRGPCRFDKIRCQRCSNWALWLFYPEGGPPLYLCNEHARTHDPIATATRQSDGPWERGHKCRTCGAPAWRWEHVVDFPSAGSETGREAMGYDRYAYDEVEAVRAFVARVRDRAGPPGTKYGDYERALAKALDLELAALSADNPPAGEGEE